MIKLNTDMPALIETHIKDVQSFIVTGDLSDELYTALYEYYFLTNQMPYGVAKARDADPMAWVADRFDEEAKDYLNIRNM